jgi:deoxyadenosine/deoxycytidine kinase
MVIVITGPIASGKSSVARELARRLERAAVRVAVLL